MLMQSDRQRFWQAAASVLVAHANQSKEVVAIGNYQHKTETQLALSASCNKIGVGRWQ
jgi:hypothetical protein